MLLVDRFENPGQRVPIRLRQVQVRGEHEPHQARGVTIEERREVHAVAVDDVGIGECEIGTNIGLRLHVQRGDRVAFRAATLDEDRRTGVLPGRARVGTPSCLDARDERRTCQRHQRQRLRRSHGVQSRPGAP
jgi:hypothetical protein